MSSLPKFDIPLDEALAVPVQEEFSGVHVAVGEMLESAIDELDALGRDVATFGAVLDGCVAKLQQDLTAAELERLVRQLAKATHNAREDSAQTEASLQLMAEELAELRAQVSALTRDPLQDGLTGIANRRAFDAAMARLMEESRGDGPPLSLIIADLDSFKAINDSYGHRVGDQVLRFVAQEMQQCVKGRDVLARYGGDEFCLLLPATPLDGAKMLAESIRFVIDSQVLSHQGWVELDCLTVSFGVAQFVPGEDAKSFISRAKACLAKSKRDGRDRVAAEDELGTH